MQNRDRVLKLTRRGFIFVLLAGAGEVIYREVRGSGMVKFTPIFVKPSQVLNLAGWKINLPAGNQQVAQPQLSNFYNDAFRVVTAVQFTATCGGEPQPGSNYARSELREMNPDGSNASWSTTAGSHVMEVTQRITHLPVVKPQLISAQIHNMTDYLIMIELDANRLYVRYKDVIAGVLDDDYQLGTFFDLRIRASAGVVDVFYNNNHKVHQAMAADTCYFKTGCYVQSSMQTGDLPTAYGQVEISSISIAHNY